MSTVCSLLSNLPTKLVCQFDCRQGAIRAIRFNVDGNYCMSAGSDKSVKLWNPYRHVHLKTYMGMGSEVFDCCGSSDNSLILAGGRDKQPTIFDVESGKMVKRWKSHGGAVNAVAFNEDSSVAISAGQDGLVFCHDVRSRGPAMQILDEARDGVLSVDVNASEIATGSADGNIRLYDIREGRLFVDFVKDSVTSLHLTADNQCLLAATMGGTIRLFEKCSGQLLADYTGHRNTDYRIEADILSSNNEVVSGSEDGRVYIWDFVESKLLTRLEHPNAVKYVHSLSAHSSKQCLITSAREKLYLWECQQPEDMEEE